MSAPPILHHVPRTISSPIVQCLLELNLVDHPVMVQEHSFADLKSESYLASFPMGTSPSFRDGNMILWESGAVLDYVLERYDIAHRLHPPPIGPSSTSDEVAARAKYMQLKHYIIATVYPFIASLFIHTLRPLDEQDPAYVKSAKAKWKELLGPVLTTWLGSEPYFVNGALTAVDILATKPLGNCHSLGLLEAEDFPALRQLWDRVSSLPSHALAYGSLRGGTGATVPAVAEPADRSIVTVPRH